MRLNNQALLKLFCHYITTMAAVFNDVLGKVEEVQESSGLGHVLDEGLAPAVVDEDAGSVADIRHDDVAELPPGALAKPHDEWELVVRGLGRGGFVRERKRGPAEGACRL